MNKEILVAIENKEYAHVRILLTKLNPVDIADILSQLDDAILAIVFRLLTKDDAAEVFSYLDSQIQKNLINCLSDKEVSAIIDDLFLDDAVDFIEEMPATVVTRVLKNASEETRKDINQFLQYPEDSAGSIMTNEFIDLKFSITVEEAFETIRNKAANCANIYICYVKDETRRLIGLITARQLLLAPKTALIKDIMETSVIKVQTTDDKEVLASLFTKYGFSAIPVVDSEQRLVGIVTFDDALLVIKEETTEDMEKMAALTPSEKPYLQTGVFRLVGNRIIWLLILMISGLLIGFIITGFEESLQVLPVLMVFVPVLMDTGGNCGSQSSTLIIRGLALGEIKLADFWKLIWKEMRIGLCIGTILMAVVIIRILIFNSGVDYTINGQANTIWNLCFAVAFAVLVTVILAKILGVILPIVAKKMKIDPAIMASPLITTIADASSLLVYFALVQLLFNGL